MIRYIAACPFHLLNESHHQGAARLTNVHSYQKLLHTSPHHPHLLLRRHLSVVLVDQLLKAALNQLLTRDPLVVADRAQAYPCNLCGSNESAAWVWVSARGAGRQLKAGVADTPLRSQPRCFLPAHTSPHLPTPTSYSKLRRFLRLPTILSRMRFWPSNTQICNKQSNGLCERPGSSNWYMWYESTGSLK